jgi:hypothetical protein
MAQRTLSYLVLTAFTVAAVACTAGSTVTTGYGTDAGSSSSPTDPAEGAGKDSALGEACTDYFACCDEVAEKVPQAATSCASTKTQVANAEAKGVSTNSFEAACKSGVDAFKSAGYCTPSTPSTPATPSTPPPAKKACPSTCTTDADCANSCPSIAGSVSCCDSTAGVCYAAQMLACPKPVDGGVPPPSY